MGNTLFPRARTGGTFDSTEWGKCSITRVVRDERTLLPVFHYACLWWPLNCDTGVICRALQPLEFWFEGSGISAWIWQLGKLLRQFMLQLRWQPLLYGQFCIFRILLGFFCVFLHPPNHPAASSTLSCGFSKIKGTSECPWVSGADVWPCLETLVIVTVRRPDPNSCRWRPDKPLNVLFCTGQSHKEIICLKYQHSPARGDLLYLNLSQFTNGKMEWWFDLHKDSCAIIGRIKIPNSVALWQNPALIP